MTYGSEAEAMRAEARTAGGGFWAGRTTERLPRDRAERIDTLRAEARGWRRVSRNAAGRWAV